MAEKHFDVIIFSEVLYYIPCCKKMINKIRRMGSYIITINFIAAMPVFSIKSVLWELALNKFQLVDRQWEVGLGILGVKTVRKID